MENTENKSSIFPKGDKGSADYFTGNTFVNMLVQNSESLNYSIANVEFQIGARTNWHTHPAGQILLVTDGNGFYQEKGKPAQIIKKGDVINIPAHVEHWHGANAKSALVHIAISNFKDGKNVDWLKPVSDDEYRSVQN